MPGLPADGSDRPLGGPPQPAVPCRRPVGESEYRPSPWYDSPYVFPEVSKALKRGNVGRNKNLPFRRTTCGRRKVLPHMTWDFGLEWVSGRIGGIYRCTVANSGHNADDVYWTG